MCQNDIDYFSWKMTENKNKIKLDDQKIDISTFCDTN